MKFNPEPRQKIYDNITFYILIKVRHYNYLPNTLSLANASNTRLEPIKLLKPALKVAVRMPTATKGGQILIGIMYIKLFCNKNRLVVAAVNTDRRM